MPDSQKLSYSVLDRAVTGIAPVEADSLSIT